MVIKYVFETGGKTLQELTNFPISGDLTPPAEPKRQAAPAAPAAQRCPIVAIGGRVIGWTDVTDGADPRRGRSSMKTLCRLRCFVSADERASTFCRFHRKVPTAEAQESDAALDSL